MSKKCMVKEDLYTQTANRKTAQQLKIDNLVVQVRVLNISNGDQILEIKLKLSLDAAHLPTHTVSSITDQAERLFKIVF